MKTMHRAPAVGAALALALTAAACGAEVEGTEDAATVTVNRCGEAIEYTTPQNAVVYEAGSADKMFALGLTVHELLAGEPAIPTTVSDFDQLERIRSRDIPDLRTLRPDLPDRVLALVQDMLGGWDDRPRFAELAARLSGPLADLTWPADRMFDEVRARAPELVDAAILYAY